MHAAFRTLRAGAPAILARFEPDPIGWLGTSVFFNMTKMKSPSGYRAHVPTLSSTPQELAVDRLTGDDEGIRGDAWATQYY